jgi:hypothetical protein
LGFGDGCLFALVRGSGSAGQFGVAFCSPFTEKKKRVISIAMDEIGQT